MGSYSCQAVATLLVWNGAPSSINTGIPKSLLDVRDDAKEPSYTFVPKVIPVLLPGDVRKNAWWIFGESLMENTSLCSVYVWTNVERWWNKLQNEFQGRLNPNSHMYTTIVLPEMGWWYQTLICSTEFQILRFQCIFNDSLKMLMKLIQD